MVLIYVAQATTFTVADPTTRTPWPAGRLLLRRRRRHRQRQRQPRLQTQRPAARQSRTRTFTTRIGLMVPGCT